MSGQNPPRDELERQMHAAAEKAQESIKLSQDQIKLDQQILDLANAGIAVVKYTTSGSVNWETPIDQWQRVNELQARRITGLRGIETVALNSASSTAGSAMLQFSSPSSFLGAPGGSGVPDAMHAREHLGKVIDRSIGSDDMILLMRTFGLDKAYPNEKSATDQFQIAWAAFDMPLTGSLPVNTSLVPMRECIETIIKELLRRRPRQEPARSWREKILSIGRQGAADGITLHDVRAWADEWDRLEPFLSGSKKAAYPRDQWLDLMRGSTLFLKSFLQGLDPSVLKP